MELISDELIEKIVNTWGTLLTTERVLYICRLVAEQQLYDDKVAVRQLIEEFLTR